MKPRLFGSLRRGNKAVEADVREEVDTHIAMWTDHLVARGVARDVAERQARARFGELDTSLNGLYRSAKLREARVRRREWWRTVARDLVFAVRQARREPTFTLIAVLTLALGIGANTAMFSVVRGVLLRPLPYRDPSRLAAIWPTRTISDAELLAFQQQAKTFDAVAAFSPGWGVAMTGGGEPRQLDAARVSTNFFQTLGVRPALGRTFRPGESDRGNWSVVVLSHSLWQSQFGGDSTVLGRVVSMDGQPSHIIGVMPAGFEAFESGVDAWLPLQIDPSSPFYTGAVALAFGRLRSTASFASATADLAALAPAIRVAFKYEDDYARGANVVDLHDNLVGTARNTLLVLLGAVALLVLISVANVGNLMLVHATGRQRELAVRRALGASTGQIIRQLLVQSVALAAMGGLVGVGVGVIGMRALKAILPPTLPLLSTVTMDGVVFATCAAVIIAAGILFGIGPALFASRVDPESTLRVGSAETSSRGTATTRQLLVVAEVALAVVLVVGAGLMTKSIWRLNRVDVGFDARGVESFLIQPSSGQIRSPEQTTTYFDEMTRRIAAIRGVRAVGAAQHLPLSGFNWMGTLDIEARPMSATATHPRIVWRSIVGDYFDAMRIPLLRGRRFASTDTRATPGVVIISSSMARHYWPGQDPIGQRIKLGNGTNKDWAMIVGIVGDVRSATPDAAGVDEAYRPNTQQGLDFMHYVVRGNGDPRLLAVPLRAAVRSLDSTVPFAQVRSLDELFSVSIASRRTVALLLIAFAALGLTLGAIGIYGVIAYGVGQRTRELGIRTALGAVQGRITLMVIGEALRVSAIGVAIGVAGAIGAAQGLKSLMFGVTTYDPLVYGTVTLGLLTVAIAAAYVPARRAARVDPLTALRQG